VILQLDVTVLFIGMTFAISEFEENGMVLAWYELFPHAGFFCKIT